MKHMSPLYLTIALAVVPVANATDHFDTVPSLDTDFPLPINKEIHGVADWGVKFKSVSQVCYTVTYESDERQFAPLLFRYEDGSHLWGMSFYPYSNQQNCATPSYQLRQELMKGKVNIETKAADFPLTNFVVTIVGEMDYSGDVVSLDAGKYTLGYESGSVYHHYIEPDVTYSLDLLQNSAVIEQAEVKSVGVAYLDKNGKQVIDSVKYDETTYLTGSDSLSLFFIGDRSQAEGTALLNIKKVNID